jgi:hypothetical protein
LRRTVTLVAYRGELDYGLRHASAAILGGGAGFASVAQFLVHWSRAGEAFAVMDTEMFDELTARGMQMRILSRDAHRVLVARQ